MNPSKMRKIINNGKKVFDTIKRITGEKSPYITMKYGEVDPLTRSGLLHERKTHSIPSKTEECIPGDDTQEEFSKQCRNT
jgi:hypothetical protein